ncbi:hypothetical protein DEJ30_12020 [Curtobacterium sp. MCPF17_003]|uniref:hypothetical protein n=1 Tax=Curtobacterium sp. MCPF17_003 TaxID=2175637 RepID=UPI000D8D7060|nr:hypothetical protein [Curtobacterium sp. MCPF17_003]PYY63633.1 hypothetical protein DEJ30_12020 [Curtobacterium sp. MCPF17_003]
MTDAKTDLFKPGDRVYFTGWTPPTPDFAPAEPAEWATVTDYPTGDPDRVSVVYDGQPDAVFPAAVQYLVTAADAPEPDPKTVVDLDAHVSGLVLEERARQDARWGAPKHLPNGTGSRSYPIKGVHDDYSISEDNQAAEIADWAKSECDLATAAGDVTYRHILVEEHFEALAEDDPEKLFDELIQVAAVAQKWCRALIEHQGVQR